MDKKPFTLTPARRAALERIAQGGVEYHPAIGTYRDSDSRLAGSETRTIRALINADLARTNLPARYHAPRKVIITNAGQLYLDALNPPTTEPQKSPVGEQA